MRTLKEGKRGLKLHTRVRHCAGSFFLIFCPCLRLTLVRWTGIAHEFSASVYYIFLLLSGYDSSVAKDNGRFDDRKQFITRGVVKKFMRLSFNRLWDSVLCKISAVQTTLESQRFHWTKESTYKLGPRMLVTAHNDANRESNFRGVNQQQKLF